MKIFLKKYYIYYIYKDYKLMLSIAFGSKTSYDSKFENEKVFKFD